MFDPTLLRAPEKPTRSIGESIPNQNLNFKH